MKTTQNLFLSRLKNRIRFISKTQCDFFVEGSITALENQGHTSGVILKVEGDISTTFKLRWRIKPVKGGWQEPKVIAENGSIAIGFFLILELTEYEIIQQAVIGTGFDYWLGFKESSENYDKDNFLNARLELSGINNDSLATINARVREKIKQTGVSDYLNIPAYIIVTEFGQPISLFIKK